MKVYDFLHANKHKLWILIMWRSSQAKKNSFTELNYGYKNNQKEHIVSL